MEALPKALDPLFESNTIPYFSDFFLFLVPNVNGNNMTMLVVRGVNQGFGGVVNQENNYVYGPPGTLPEASGGLWGHILALYFM